MTDPETIKLTRQLARLGQGLEDIKCNQVRHEGALVDLFQGLREMAATVSGLDTVVRMSTSEQKRINQQLKDEITGLKKEQKSMKTTLDIQMRGVERRLAYFAGGLAVLLLVFDLAVRYGLKTMGG